MNKQIRKFSLALASAFALGLVGCGSPDAGGGGTPNPGPGPGPVTPPPGETLAYPPVVHYDLFAPKTEQELKAVYGVGENEGLPIANYGYLIARTTPGFDLATFAKYGLEVKSGFSIGGSKFYYLHKESDLVETMKRLKGMDGLLYIEPEIMNYTTAGIVYDNPDRWVANQWQYGAFTTHAKKAWETYGFGPNRPIVAAIDTGVNYRHEDMVGVVANAFTWYADNGSTLLFADNTTNTLLDPNPNDWMVTKPNQNYGTDPSSLHGSHTAGTIASMGNNGKGVAGMCWNVDLVSYKGLNNSGSGGSWAIYGSLWHLARWRNEMVNGAPRYPHTIPVNMSVGAGAVAQFNVDMVEMALEHDIVLICSSGNDTGGFSSFPGSITGAIRVGAVDYMDRRADFSNWGNDMSVMAPGVQVLSGAGDNSDYYWMSGTSMAAPHVTGLVGYMLNFAPDLKADQIRTYLEKNTDPLDGQKGFDPRYGYGRINVYKTIGAVLDDLDNNRVPASNYALSPVKVTVKNAGGALLNGVVVYLYNCNQAGTITSYAAFAPTGVSYVGVRDDAENEPENGVAWFNMLKPGYYKATASYSMLDLTGGLLSATAESDVFEVRQGLAVAPVTLTIDINPPLTLYVQTMATSNTTRQSGDTCIDIWDSNRLLLEYDSGLYDTVSFALGTPGTYWIRIYAYGTSVGEYGMWLGTERQPTPAPGTFADPGPNGVKGSQAFTKETAQLIQINDKMVYGDMTPDNRASGDWYKFVIE